MPHSDLINYHTDRLLAKKNVVGVGYGQKWSDGRPIGGEAILVFVTHKEPLFNLAKEDVIESSLDGITTDVVGRTGIIYSNITAQKFVKLGRHNHPLAPKRPKPPPPRRPKQPKQPKRPIRQNKIGSSLPPMRARPLIGGMSIGHPWVTAGTLGGIFKDASGDIVLLSNNHVLAAENRGGTTHGTVQPGIIDGGIEPRDTVGRLKSFSVLTKSGYNYEDSAISKPFPEIALDYQVRTIGKPAGFALDYYVGMSVRKHGRTTGYTTGKIIATNANLLVYYDMGPLMFSDCIITNNMASGGDSGSLLFDHDKNVVGLLFAGSNSVTIFNPIKYTIDRYGLQIL